MNNSRVGIALVTHNSVAFLQETLDSIESQLASVSAVRVVDDHSQDGTTEMLADWVTDLRSRGIDAHWQPSTSSAEDSRTRTAQNFTHAARALRSVDLIALADHDDRWLPNRLTQQTNVMEQDPEALYLAGNGTLTEEPATLFEAFEVPSDLDEWRCERIARHVIRHSVATGSASMIRGSLLEYPAAVPPPGWLHDRWWSLLAASQCGLRVDAEPVLDYRVDATQQVGLDRGRQVESGASRLCLVRPGDLAKLRDLVALRSCASHPARGAFSPASVIRSVIS